MTAELESQIAALQTEIREIQQRNSKVESDKAWETSPTRIIAICATTYVVALALLWLLHSDQPWLDATVPVVGFFLSSRSLPELKQWWIKNRYR